MKRLLEETGCQAWMLLEDDGLYDPETLPRSVSKKPLRMTNESQSERQRPSV